MKSHTVKIIETKNGKITKASLKIGGVEKMLSVSKSGKVFDESRHIGRILRDRGRWFENQWKVIFND